MELDELKTLKNKRKIVMLTAYDCQNAKIQSQNSRWDCG